MHLLRGEHQIYWLIMRINVEGAGSDEFMFINHSGHVYRRICNQWQETVLVATALA